MKNIVDTCINRKYEIMKEREKAQRDTQRDTRNKHNINLYLIMYSFMYMIMNVRIKSTINRVRSVVN